MNDQVKIGVVGCMGRMGQALVAAIGAEKNAVFAGGTESQGSDLIGRAIGDTGLSVSDDPSALFQNADVVVDFTCPTATVAHAAIAASNGTALVVGTTGLTIDDHAALDTAAAKTVIVQAGNMSLGVNLLTALTKRVAAALDSSYDIEVLEMHHKHKVDAPSGTALMLGEAAAAGRGIDLETNAVKARDGITGAREEGSIGFATLRGGGVVGDHSVIFAGEHEQITISHHAEDRGLFAVGAVKAALWCAKQKAGRYDMMDVLDI